MSAEAWREELRQIIREVVVEVVAELRDQDAPERESKHPGLLTAREAAAALGRSLTFIREHRQELLAVTFGKGEKARIFIPRGVVEALISGDLAIHSKPAEVPKPKAHQRRRTSNVELLPIRGETAA